MPDSISLGIIEEHDVPVAMRDGVVLRANVFRPDVSGKFPGLLLRTPYGKPAGGQERLVRAGYVVVTQDTRGRYASDGEHRTFTVEETGDGDDGFDTIEWLADEPWCNGRIGTFGASYNAWMQWQAARLKPPSLEAMAAWTIPVELTELDWPGAFRPARRIKWWLGNIAPDLRKRHGMTPPHNSAEANAIWNDLEHGRWLGLLPWIKIADHLPPGLAEDVRDWLQHPNRRPWKFPDHWKDVDVPNLDFSGWYDHCNSTIGHLAGMQQNGGTESARKHTKLIVGPWSHPTIGQRKLGDADFGPQAQVDITDILIRWFNFWLKDAENGMEKEPAVRYFMMGAKKWRSSSTWPPHSLQTVLYMGGSSPDALSLSEDATEAESSVDYTYDPHDPVPTLWDRNLFTSAGDRNKLNHRTDILRFRTEPLEEEIDVAGNPEVVLYAKSSAIDTDFFARLVDEDPEGGPAIEVSYGLVRARHRDSLDEEDFLTSNKVTEFRIKLGPTANSFRVGHRIRVEITSSDFPNHDRNHNTGGKDLEESEMQNAEQTILCGGEFTTRIILPVV